MGLCLAENKFTSLPPVVCTMTSLTDLRLERNELTFLTPLVGNLVNLRTFDIANNVRHYALRTIAGIITLTHAPNSRRWALCRALWAT